MIALSLWRNSNSSVEVCSVDSVGRGAVVKNELAARGVEPFFFFSFFFFSYPKFAEVLLLQLMV